MTKQVDTSFNAIFKRFIFVVIGFLTIITVLLVSLSAGGKTEPDFIAYQPTIPLAGQEVTEITKENGSNNGKFKPAYKQKYSSGIILTQTKASTGLLSCDDKEQVPAETISRVNDTCDGGTTRHGGRYTVKKTFIDDELHMLNVNAQIGEAWLYVYIPDDYTEAKLAEFTEWQEYFNSMQPVDLTKKSVFKFLQ